MAPEGWDREAWDRDTAAIDAAGASPAVEYLGNKEEALRALVFCGPGNNGGDGFVVARLLRGLGWDVSVRLFGEAERLPPDARVNYERWLALGSVGPLTGDPFDPEARPDLILDAVFGIGVNRPLPSEVEHALSHRARSRAYRVAFKTKLVAVDIPSGLSSDTGKYDFNGLNTREPALSKLTVTFHSPKLGHYLGSGPAACGKLAVVDIGLRGDGMERSGSGLRADAERVRLVEPVRTGKSFRKPLPMGVFVRSHLSKHKERGQHKYDHGSVLVFGGGVGKGGAARLAARGALRVGAGLVTVSVPPSALQENACQLTAIMLRADKDAGAFAEASDDRVSGYCLGPGLGVGDRTRGFVAAVTGLGTSERHWRRPAVVLDADALTSFEADPAALFALTHERCVMTPHAGEFARLFPDISKERRQGRLAKTDAAREAADRAGCVVLLKGPDTVIAAPGGPCAVHAAAYDREVPWLATAGAGDVLAGMIAGIAASPFGPDIFCVAEIAVWLHTECALEFGPGLIAEDIPEMLPRVFRRLEL
ncbi:MAG: NAD(P)H-hydrate dehydratase [Pseudomonadota bacterium]